MTKRLAKTVFLTKSEAKQKLNEMERGKNDKRRSSKKNKKDFRRA